MAFPTSPVNNQTAVVNGITYAYSSANNAWTRVTATDLTLAGNLIAGANIITTNGIFWAANGLAYSSAGSNNPFDSDSNLGLVTSSVTSLFDLGFTTDISVTEFYELGTLVSNSVVYGTSIIANTISGSRLITGTDIAAGILTASNVTGAILVSTGTANIAGNLTTANVLIANVTISANAANPSAAQINGVDIATVDNYDLDDISNYTDGVKQVFPLTYNLSNVSINSPWQLTVAVNGILLPAFNNSPNAYIVWQSLIFPANKGYTLESNSSIKFAEAPGARSDVYIRKQPGTTPSVIKVYPFKPIDIMVGY